MVETIKENFICPDCKEITIYSHIDDTQQKWYRCPNGHQTTQPIKNQTQPTKLYCPQCQMPTYKQTDETYKCRFNHITETALTEPEYFAYMRGKASQAKTQREAEEEETEQEQNKKESMADRAFKLFMGTGAELFHDQHKIEYARLPLTLTVPNDTNDINGICYNKIPSSSFTEKKEIEEQYTDISPENTVNTVNTVRCFQIVRLKDSQMRSYIAYLLFEAEEKIINNESINQVITLLKYYASKGKQYNLYNRVARSPDGTIWIDIADQQNRAYHVTKEGWTIETNTPIMFKRYAHQLPLAIAVKGGDPKKILPFINIGASKNSEYSKRRQLLLLIQTASYGIQNMSHPINAMFGCPGSHKSTAQKYLRRIWDPSSAELVKTLPRDENTLMQILDHHYMPIFDNLSYMPDWASDDFCSAVTGTGIEVRALYTDDESFIRAFKRCVLLNGVNLPAKKGDLLSRAILHPTEPTLLNRTDSELDNEYYKLLPEILGGFLDLLSKALQLEGTIKPSKYFRLADFTEWGCVLSVALGSTPEEFIKAMTENLNAQNQADIEGNKVADVFLQLFSGSLDYLNATEDTPIKLTPDEVFNKLTIKASEMGVNVKSKIWPTAANAFTRKLNNSKNAIMASGWNYEINHDGTKRVMSIWRIQTEKPDNDENIQNPTIPENKDQVILKVDDSGVKKLEIPVETVHYLLLSDNDPASQPCGRCGGVQSKYKVTSNLSKNTYFMCKGCFDAYRAAVEKQGVRFIDDTMPDYTEVA